MAKVSLGSLAVAAKGAGASQELVAQLAREATAAKEERQTPGGRLDSAQARADRAAKKVTAAREAAEAAAAKLAAAEAEDQVARDELATVEAEVAQAPASSPLPSLQEFAASTRRLLLALENLPLVSPSAGREAEPVLRAMAELHRVMGSAGAAAVASDVPATLSEAVASAVRGEQTLDEVADVLIGDTHFAEGSEDEASEPYSTEPPRRRQATSGAEGGGAGRSVAEPGEERHGSRTPPRGRGASGKGSSSGGLRR